MNRRGFLKSLLGAAAGAALAPTLGRVYSFPTNIVIAQPNLPQAYAKYYEKADLANLKKNVIYMFGQGVFCVNLNAQDTPLINLHGQVLQLRPDTNSIRFFDVPHVGDPEGIVQVAASGPDHLTSYASLGTRRLCSSLPVTSILDITTSLSTVIAPSCPPTTWKPTFSETITLL